MQPSANRNFLYQKLFLKNKNLDEKLIIGYFLILGMENTQENLNEAEPKLPNVKHNQHYFIAYK